MTIYMYVLAYKLNGQFWSLDPEGKKSVNKKLIDFINGFKKNLISIKYYKSVRHDNDILFWSTAYEPINLENLRRGLILHLAPMAIQHTACFHYMRIHRILRREKPGGYIKTDPKKYLWHTQ